MLSKKTKILQGACIFLLFCVPVIWAEFRIFLLITIILISLVISVVITGDIRKLKNSLVSRILTVVLVNLILYLVIALFFVLSPPEGEYWLWLEHDLVLFGVAFSLFLAISYSVVLVLLNEGNINEQIVEKNPNKILSVALIVILLIAYLFLSSYFGWWR